MILELKEPRRHLGRLISRIRNININDFFYSAGARVHDDDSLRENDRLFHVMRDEETGLLLLLPGLQKFGLQLRSGLRVQRTERFVHQKDFRIHRVT